MKFKYILFALTTFFVSCSNEMDPIFDDLDGNKENGDNLYLNFRILTADSGFTRADHSVGEDYDTGTEDESAIKNGMVYIFKGTSEADAVCVAYGNIGEKEVSKENSGYLSVKNLECRNIKISAFGSNFDIDENGSYFALVLLNVNNNSVYPVKDEKFKDWASTPLENTMLLESDGMTYITMANATGMYSSTGTEDSFKPTTLFPIDLSDFSRSEKTGEIKTVIIVQRNVVRVNVISDLKDFSYKNVTIGEFNVQVDIANWNLQVTNSKTYPVMNTDGLTWEKEYSKSGFLKLANNEFYDRVFWAKDPNYHSSEVLNNNNFLHPQNINIPAGTPVYCLENTFDTDCMLQGQTTRVVIKGRWKFENYQEDSDRKWGYIPSGHDFRYPDNPEFGVFYRIRNQETLYCRKCFEDKAKELFANGNLTFEWLQVPGGYYPLKGLLKIYNNGVELHDDQYNSLAQAFDLMNADTDLISHYENCYCYYVLRIPHFSDDVVPWDNEKEVTKKADGTGIADYDPVKHLGRYGVLRNVSYAVTVHSIHNLGSPCIPEITDADTDDMPDQELLGVEIKNLPWRYVDQGSFTLGK